jgi:hypothetical protein
MDGEGRSKRIATALGVETDESMEQRGEFQRRFLALGMEALRREKISQAKFLQLAERVGVSQWSAQDLLVNAGIDDAEAQHVLLPE